MLSRPMKSTVCQPPDSPPATMTSRHFFLLIGTNKLKLVLKQVTLSSRPLSQKRIIRKPTP